MKITFLTRRFHQLLRPSPRRRISRHATSDFGRQTQRLEDRALLHAGHVELDELETANGGDGSEGAIIEGIDAGDQAGQSVASAGDINGDGRADFVVSAHLGDHASVSDDGELYVLFGTSAGFGAEFDPATLNGTNGFRIDGGLAADHAAYSVASAGDINNDGKADLLFGAPDADPSSRAAAGSAYVVFGAASFAASVDVTALTGTNGFRIDGAVAGDGLGFSVAAAGDVNNDGFDDVLLGAPLNDAGAANAGAAYVVFGKGTSFGASIDLSTLTTTTGYRITGTTASDKFGFAVASTGDLNNDNFADIVVGAPLRDPSGGTDGGAAYVVFGQASGFANIAAASLNGTTGFRLDGLNTSDQTGYAVNGAGDINDDGFDDVIVSSPRAEVGGVSVGASYVVFGKSSAYSASFAVSALTGTAGFRIAMDYASDPWLSSWIVNTTGALGITNGASNGILADVLSVVPDGNDVFVKANSVPSYSIGLWPGNPNSPSAQNRLYQIPRDPVVNTGTKTATGLGANGITIDGVQIYNSLDGKSFNNQNVWHQNAYYSEGSTLDSNGAHPDQGGNYHIHIVPNSLLAKVGDNSSTHSSILGWSFDGFPIYGPYGFANTDGTGGVVRMDSSWRTRSITQRTTLASGTDVLDGPPVGGPNPIGTFIEDYEFVSGLGHLDRYNGRFAVTPEFPLGMYHYVMTLDSSLTPSFPYILAPELNGVVETKNTTNTVGSPNDVPVSVGSIGDFNADGIDDLIIGNPNAYVSGEFVAGTASVFYGHKGAFAADFSLSMLDGTNGFLISGIAQNDGTGTSVSGGADFNGDGGFDLLIGAPGGDPNGDSAAGRAYVLFGDATALTLSLSLNSISENGGTATGTITRPGSTTSLLVVTLASSDTSEAVVPATVTIAAGQSSATFTVSAVDDAMVDGSLGVTLTASATDFTNGLASLTVTDHEALTLTIAGSQISENGGSTTATVTRTDATGNLTVTLLSSDTTEAVILATINIVSGQLTSATVPINSVNDDEVDGSRTVTFTGSAPGYVPDSESLTVTDDDIASFTIVQSGGATIVGESGLTDTFSVVLTAQPASNVVLSVLSGDTTEATVSVATLTFTAANWNVPQSVTVTGINDVLTDGNVVSAVTLSVVDASYDNTFDAVADQTVSVITTDNDSPGFTITASGGSTTVTEAGSTDSFTVVLNAQPASNVVLSVVRNDPTETSISTTSLTFTSANWNVAQTVTVTGLDDLLDDGDVVSTVALSVVDASSDNAFDLVPDQGVSVTTTDNDSSGFTIAQTGGMTSVTEVGSTDSFSVVLTAQPTSNVVLSIVSGDTTEAAVSAATLTFTTANWNVAQTVTVTGVDDALDDGDVGSTVSVSVNDASSDNTFDPLPDQSVNVTTTDNDSSGFTLSQTAANVRENGTTDSFTVVLTAQPTSNVVLSVASGDTTEANVSAATLTFTTANWNVAQTVTVTGVDDELDDGDIVSTVTVSVVDASSDNTFDVLANQTVSVTTADNDGAGVTISPNSGTTNASPITFTFQFEDTVTGFEASDISLTNGIAGSFTAIDGDTFTLLVTPVSDGTVTVSVAANAAQDAAGNNNALSTASVTSDRTAPSVAVNVVGASLNDAANSSSVTFDFSEVVTGFTAADVSVTGGALTNFSGSGTHYSATFTATNGVALTGSVSVGTDYSDLAGNLGTGGSDTVAVNTVNATVTVTIVESSLNDAINSSAVTFEFSEAVTGFEAADVTCVGGALTNFSGSGSSYSATFTASDGVATTGSVTVGTGTTNAAGNAGIASSDTVTIDTLNPTVTVNIVDATLSDADSSSLVTFVFSSVVTGFTVSGVTATGGVLSNFSGSGSNYSATFTVPDATTATGSVSVAADYADAVGNVGATGSDSVTIDRINPTVAVNIIDESLNDADSSSSVTFEFSEAVTGFTVADVLLTGGLLTSFSGSGSSYVATFTATNGVSAPGSVSVGTGYGDAAGNVGSGGSDTVSIDRLNPAVIVNIEAVSLSDADNVSSVTFEFSELVSGFEASDVAVTGGVLTDFSGSGTSYSATFTANDGVSATGTVSVGTGYSDAAGNVGIVGSDTVVIDRLNPTLTVNIVDASLSDTDSTSSVTFSFSSVVTGFDASDVTATGGGLTNFAGSGSSYSAIFTATDGSSETGSVTASADYTDAVGNAGNAGGSDTVAIDRLNPTVTVNIEDVSLSDADRSSLVTLVFSEPVTGLSVSDLTSVGGTLTGFSGSGRNYSATFAAADGRTDAGSVSVGTGYVDGVGNIGTSSSATGGSDSVAIDTLNPTVVVNIVDVSLNDADNSSSVTFVFSESVTGFELADVAATGGLLTNFSGSGSSYSATFTATDGLAVTGSVTVGTGYIDAAGNAGAGGSDTVAIDTAMTIGQLTINLLGSQSVVVTAAATGNVQVLVNGVLDPAFAAIPAASVLSVTVNGGTGSNLIDLRGVTLAAFPSISGSVSVQAGAGNDVILGGEFSEQLNGGDGDDSLEGGAGNDSLDGGLGNDVLSGGSGADNLIGGTDTDTVRETADLDMTLTSTTLVSSLIGQATITDVLSGFEAAVLTGGPAANRIDASTFVVGTGLGVTLIGAAGNDVLTSGIGRDSLIGDEGDDILNAGSGNDSVLGGVGRDSVTGGAGADSISGGDGFDTVFGGTGNDTIDGGLGNDVISGQDNDDSILGGGENDKLTGAAGNDFIDGGLGDDTLSGDAGLDSLFGRDGADLLVGGTENDRLEGESGADRLRGEAGLDTLLGGAGADNMSGGADADSLDGGDDNDSLFGDFGNDIVLGGAGDDQLRGHEGQDVIDGGAGTGDKISEEGDTNFTITGLRIVSALYGDETPTNIERFNLAGGAGANVIDGRQSSVKLLLNGLGGNDTLLGGAFIDNLFGGDGDDVLSGGGSNDIIDGGLGSDFFYERANANVTITGLQVVSIGISPSIGTGTETLVGIENIALVGGDSANTLNAAQSSLPVILLGGKGNDTLIGSNFNDVLIGGNRADSVAGTDSLTGGPGADTFDSDPADTATRVTDGTDSVIANVFASPLPTWLDLI